MAGRKLEYFAQRRNTTEELWKVMAYQTAGVNFPVESNNSFKTKAEAEAASIRMNAGDETGMSFGSYSDD
jgi:hypothetical protein